MPRTVNGTGHTDPSRWLLCLFKHPLSSMQTNYQKFKILGDPKIRGIKLGKLEQPIQGLAEGMA